MSPPLSEAEVGAFADVVTGSITQSAAPFNGILDADAAVAMAIESNQTVRAARYEVEVEAARLRVERGELLPDVVAESEYYKRDRPQLSRSNLSRTYSTSSEMATLSRTIELSFNIIDFGLTLLRMRQAGDRTNQKFEEVRRVASRIAEETRSTYWRAVALQTLTPQLSSISGEVADALKLSRRAMRDPEIDAVDAIDYQRDLLNTRRELNDIRVRLAGAEYQLKTLAAIPLESTLTLSTKRGGRHLHEQPGVACDDVARALRQRPEIRRHMYELRITSQEVDAAILKILPGATLTQSFKSDSNAYLYFGDWTSISARLAAQLMEAVRLPNKIDAINAGIDLERRNAIATASIIAMEVYVARAKLAVAMNVYDDADEFSRNQAALFHQVQSAVAAGKLPEHAIARERLADLLARVRAIVAYGELEAAQAAYESALGNDVPDPAASSAENIKVSQHD